MGNIQGKFFFSKFYFGGITLREGGRSGGFTPSALASGASGPGARFSKFPVITGPVKLFCFPFQIGVSKVLTIIQ